MKKKKIKKGIILLSMVMVIISTVLPVTSSASGGELGGILYTITNGNSEETKEAFPYMLQNANLIEYMETSFITIQLEENSETIYPVRASTAGNSTVNLFMSSNTYPYLRIFVSGNTAQCVYTKEYTFEEVTPYKITVYEITTPVVTPVPTATPKPTATPTPKPTATPSPTPSPKPTASPSPKPTASPSPTPMPTETPEPDERVENLLDETGNGIGTILKWIKELWNGITTGEMSAILPIFAIFVIIPIILLVIKIIRKSTWGD